MKSRIRVSIAGARASAIGKEHGVTSAELKALQPALDAGHKAMRADRRSKRIGFFELHNDHKRLRTVHAAVKRFSATKPKNLVVLGIGGSALGISTLVRALKPAHYNLIDEQARGASPRIFVVDNVDPETFSTVLELCDPSETVFNLISKSGGTAETLSQSILVLDQIEKRLGKGSAADRVVVTSDPPPKGKALPPLLGLAKKYHLHTLEMPANVGGRFSVFSAVGLFPAAMIGLDIDAMLAGCAAMDHRCSTASLPENPAYLRAALQSLAYEKGKCMSVMMPYADSLSLVSDWYRQLWAESLGKTIDTPDGPRSIGQTPIKALGVTDQHSQLQLYLEGPNDKTITVLDTGKMRQRLSLPAGVLAGKDAPYLRGKSMRDLLQAECKATIGALREAQRPVMTIRVNTVDAFAMGELLYMLELETAMAAQLLGVDAYDQPAVERIKVLTREHLGAKR